MFGLDVICFIGILVGAVSLILGVSNRMRRLKKGEKATTGTVKDFDFIYSEKYRLPIKYKATIKAGQKTYNIEKYSMPWLIEGEEVRIQITGNQKVLGNERLKKRSIIELIIGFILTIIPLVAMYIISVFII